MISTGRGGGMVYTKALRAFIRKGVRVRLSPAVLFIAFRVNYSMAYFAYIFQCSDGMYYTGITWNLKRRVSEHNTGIKTSIQPSRRPVKLVYWERFSDRILAAKKEKQIKGFSRLKKEKLIKSLR